MPHQIAYVSVDTTSSVWKLVAQNFQIGLEVNIVYNS